MANMLDSEILVSELDLQWRKYIHFQTINFGKDMKTLIPPRNGLNSTANLLLQECYGIR